MAGTGATPVDNVSLQFAQNNPLGVAPAAQPEAVTAPPVGVLNRSALLRNNGVTVNLAAHADTIGQGAFGLRSILADPRIGYLNYGNSSFQDNPLRYGHPLGGSRANQGYAGQLPTYVTAQVPFVTFDMSRFGLSDVQVVIGAAFANTNWPPLEPDEASLGTAFLLPDVL